MTVLVMIPSSAELSVLVGVGDWGKTISLRVIQRGTAVCPLWKPLPTSTLSEEATTCFNVLHCVWISLFDGGGSFGAFVGSSDTELRY